MTNKQVQKNLKMQNFVTREGTIRKGASSDYEKEQKKYARVEEAKTKHQTF